MEHSRGKKKVIMQQMEDKGGYATVRLCENREYERRMRLRRHTQNSILDSDRISCLPEHIIHHILGFLPAEDAARTSILSKAWKAFCSSYPIVPVLRFDFNNFALKFLLAHQQPEPEPDIDDIRARFFDFVDSQLSNIKQRSLPVRKVALTVALHDSTSFSRIDHWMDLIRELSEVVELCFFVQTKDTKWEDEYIYSDLCYYLPSSILASKGLCSLSARGCMFASLDMPAPFSSLQQLSISQTFFDVNAAINMPRCCPGIQVLELKDCTFGMRVLQLSEFPKLKQASFINCFGRLSKIDLQGTQLEKFECEADYFVGCEFSAAACRDIRELILIGCTIFQPHLLLDLTATFSLLEEAEVNLEQLEGADLFDFKAASHYLRRLSFSVHNSVGIKKISVDCPNLEWFKFLSFGLKEIYLNCPNLQKFCFTGDAIPVFPLLFPSPGVKDIYFQLGGISYLDDQWFTQLRGLIEQFAEVGRTIHLHLRCIPRMVVNFVAKELEALPASQLNNVHLQMLLRMEDSDNPGELVDGLIWSTRPTTLAIRGVLYPFIEDICEKLAKKSRGETCKEFCKKCWWHQLEGFEVESLSENEGIMGDLAAFVEMCRRRISTMTCFKFNWCSHSSIPPTKSTEFLQSPEDGRTKGVFRCHLWNGSQWIL